MRRTGWMVGSGVLAAAAAVAVAVPVFACTVTPSLNLSQLYGPAGTTIQMSGANWLGNAQGPVSVHWDHLNGPVLATTLPDAMGNLGPVAVSVPEPAAPGYHVLIAATANPTTTTRAVFQVTGTSGSGAGAPQAAMPVTGSNQASGALSAGLIGLIAALGVAGLVLVGIGSGVLVSGLTRRSAAGRVHRR